MRCPRVIPATMIAVCAIGLVPSCKKIDHNQAAAQRSIEIDGSSTVGPITEAVATDFRKVRPDVSVTVKISGSGGGFKRFCVGDTDISDASRPIKQSELERARQNKVQFIELPIAFDGITLAVNPANTWVDHLTIPEIRRIFAADSTVKTWADVRPGWPHKPISLWTPGVDDGTFDFFQEAVFPDKAEIRIGDLNLSEDDHVLVRGIASDPNALGFFGYAYYASNTDKLRAVPIDPGDGHPVMPSHDSIADGSYHPLSRPLYIYVNATSAKREDVAAFVQYYLDNAARLAEAVGYVRLKPEHYKLSQSLFKNRTTGTKWMTDAGDNIQAPISEVYGL